MHIVYETPPASPQQQQDSPHTATTVGEEAGAGPGEASSQILDFPIPWAKQAKRKKQKKEEVKQKKGKGTTAPSRTHHARRNEQRGLAPAAERLMQEVRRVKGQHCPATSSYASGNHAPCGWPNKRGISTTPSKATTTAQSRIVSPGASSRTSPPSQRNSPARLWDTPVHTPQ